MTGGYKVITLCGSTRFKDSFIETQKRSGTLQAQAEDIVSAKKRYITWQIR